MALINVVQLGAKCPFGRLGDFHIQTQRKIGRLQRSLPIALQVGIPVGRESPSASGSGTASGSVVRFNTNGVCRSPL